MQTYQDGNNFAVRSWLPFSENHTVCPALVSLHCIPNVFMSAFFLPAVYIVVI